MAKKTVEQVVEKFRRGIEGAGQDYANGVQNPSKPWASATVAGAARWRTGIQQAIANNSFQKGVSAAGDAKWQSRAAGIGAQRFQAAASEAATAYAEKASLVMAAAAAAQSAVSSMPTETQEQRIARAAASMRTISQYWQNRSK